ncbi:MAG: hemolysin family protein [candidate division KSB1 bacterium]|nr:hemolysin family protein [candidate division KSB1 bacterium]
MTGELQIAFLALILSILYSGSEAIFYSINRLKIEVLQRKKARGADAVLHYLNNPEKYLSTILVGNNIANVLFGSFAAIYLSRFVNEAVVSLISTGIVLLFGEIIPKSLLRAVAEPASLRMVRFVKMSERLFAPLILLLTLFARWVTRRFKRTREAGNQTLSKEDIRLLFRESRYLGHIHYQDEEFVRRILKLGTHKVRQIMIPRTEIEAVPESASIEEIKQSFIRTHFSRLPVYKDSIDHIVGAVYARDFFINPDAPQKIIHRLPFVPETKSVLSLLNELRRAQASIAIVIDEYGGTAGLVTLEDIIEEIFGEIADEYDFEGVGIERVSPDEAIARGRAEIEAVNAELGLNLPEGDYETLAGYIIHELGRIPKPGESLEVGDWLMIITHASPQKIDRVKILKKKG